MGLKLLLGYRREHDLVLKVSDLIIFFQKREGKFKNLKRIIDFCFDLFLNQNVYSLKDTPDKRRFLEREQILGQINLNQAPIYVSSTD